MSATTNSKAIRSLKVFIHPIDATGHINACIGLGQALLERGHQIYFLSESSFKGHYEPFGFKEILLESKSNADKEVAAVPKGKNPIKAMSEMLIESGLLSSKGPEEKIRLIIDNDLFFKDGYTKAVAYNSQIQAAIDQEKPDLFIVDNFIVEPAILYSGVPWVYSFSANPLSAYRSKDLPPFGIGFAANSDKEAWKPFKEIEQEFAKKTFDAQNKILKHFNYPEIVFDENSEVFSKYLNIYGFPEELDYHDITPKPENFVRVDAFCRKLPDLFQLPDEFQKKIKPGDKLIFLSMGSMGSFDVELMKRLIATLAKSKHKYIVSKGLLHDEFELADNMWGGSYVPQTSILPLVDLVITHGGNNSVTESFSFGKPMIVMPLFADQFDNAQRIHEKGFGIKIEAYHHTEQELIDGINRLLNDAELNEKLTKISERIQNSNSKEMAAIAIEEMVEKHREQN